MLSGQISDKLFLFVSVLAQTFFAFVRGHFMSLSFLTARHNIVILINNYPFFTISTKTFAGLNAGIL